MEDSLRKRYLIKLSATFINGLVNAIILALVPKSLGPLAYGYFNFIQQYFNQIISFLDAGTSTAFFTKLSARNNRKELILFYAIFSLGLCLILWGIVFFVDSLGLATFFFTEIPIKYIYLGINFCFFTWLTQLYIKVSDAFALTVSVEFVKIFHRLLMLALILYIVEFHVLDLTIYYYYQFFLLLSFVFVLTILFLNRKIISAETFKIKINYFKIISEFYKFCSPLFVFNVIATSIAVFDIWLLQRMSGSVQTGFYGLAYSITAMCFLFTSAMTPIITREFSKSFASNDLDNIRILFRRYVPMLYAIAAFFSLFIAFNAEQLLLIFTDTRFNGACTTLVIMAFYPLHQTYGQINAALFFASEETVKYRNIGLIFSFVGLLFSFIFVYCLKLGAEGFAWKMILVQFLSVNVQLLFNTRYLGLQFRKFLIHQLFTVLCFAFIAYLTKSLVATHNSPLFVFISSGITYSIFILISFFVIPQLFGLQRQDLTKLKSIIKR